MWAPLAGAYWASQHRRGKEWLPKILYVAVGLRNGEDGYESSDNAVDDKKARQEKTAPHPFSPIRCAALTIDAVTSVGEPAGRAVAKTSCRWLGSATIPTSLPT
jgi:hypothetical protein